MGYWGERELIASSPLVRTVPAASILSSPLVLWGSPLLVGSICSPLVQLLNCQGDGSSSSGFWQRSYGYHWEPSLPTLDLNSSVSSCYWRTCYSQGTLAVASSWAPLPPSPLSCRVSSIPGATEGVGVPCCLWSLAGSWNLCPKGRKEPRRKLKNGARRYSTGVFNFKLKQHAKC